MNEQTLRRKLLKNMVAQAPMLGWSEEALQQALKKSRLDPSYGWRLFPGGISEVIQFWSAQLDHEMIYQLKKMETAALRVPQKIALAVRVRLTLLNPHKEAARKAWGYLVASAQLPLGMKMIYTTINTIWYFAGDQSTDFNFYTKRALLYNIYISTFLYWFQDLSVENENTWVFLERQLNRVAGIPHLKEKASEGLSTILKQVQNIFSR